MNDFKHIPVLLNEAIEVLRVKNGKRYIDATLGGGGHTGLILDKGGLVLGIDQDLDALEHVENDQKQSIQNQKLFLAKGNFRDLKKIALDKGFEEVDGILFDLGVSSYQLDSSGRGFSFGKEEMLDMRMDKGSSLSAYDVVNKYPYEKLVEIFYRYGEEHNSKEIARKIVDARKKTPIQTAVELSSLIEKISHRPESIHPATRVFQALRIEVNDEINAIKGALEDSYEVLGTGGRVVVISFHSLEDRVTKQMFDRFQREGLGRVITKKPLTATFEESKKNRRARSAKMRIFEKAIS